MRWRRRALAVTGGSGMLRSVERQGHIVPGQRWTSEAEPELGLGTVRTCSAGRLAMDFPAAGEERLFALGSAPVRRVRFAVGDTIELRSGRQWPVEALEEQDGLITYLTAGGPVAEAELADTIRFSKPEERLFRGLVDPVSDYRLRVEALQQRAAIRRSPARGFLGARIDLLPHQIATAEAVASRPQPRVLLADEVGLGKTVEACLVVHRLLLTGRARRVLVMVPESLLHQWFIELLRRFNLSFSLFDAERFAALRRGGQQNPFLDSQWVLVSQDFPLSEPAVAEAVRDAPWDVLVVDEAHHLEWSPQAASPAYRLVEALAQRVPAVLLLTATPEQLGAAGHFARLRLLDPDRYDDLDAFLTESERYAAVADLVEAVEAWPRPLLKRGEFQHLARRAGVEVPHAEWWGTAGSLPVENLVSRLIDAFGPGRVLFRCTRAALGGFPPRRVVFHPLRTAESDFRAKVAWLAALCREREGTKYLVIGHTRALAEQLVEALQERVRVPVALFHEGLTLLQRDRQAAYFADPDGARLLVCSEIGSEGRNFQFAHHLVLLDLPLEPELLEQRIGRLDRIGQTEAIRIHVPFREGSREAGWARWYHEGLDAFEACLPAGHDFGRIFGPRLEALEDPPAASALEVLIADGRAAASAFRARLSSGRDRLLGLHPEARRRAEALIARIARAGEPPICEHFAVRLLDACGLVVEELAARRYRITPGMMSSEAFPGLPADGLTVTFDRAEALAREDLVFFSADHPLFSAAFDLWLEGQHGNAGFARWPHAGREGIFLEVWFVVETVAPRELHLDRFLPPTPFRVVVDHSGEFLPPAETWDEHELVEGDVGPLLERGVVRRKLLPAMLAVADARSQQRSAAVLAGAREEASDRYRQELERLQLLARLNDHVRPEEIERLENEEEAVLRALESASARTDALRLVWAQED